MSHVAFPLVVANYLFGNAGHFDMRLLLRRTFQLLRLYSIAPHLCFVMQQILKKLLFNQKLDGRLWNLVD